MNLRRWSLLAFALISMQPFRSTLASCVAPTTESLSGVALLIANRIDTLEQHLSDQERKPRPSLVFRTSDNPENTDVDSGFPSKIRKELEQSQCLDTRQLTRNLTSALQMQEPRLAVVALGNPDRKELDDRVREIGQGNIDPSTISALRAFEVNYVVIIEGKSAVDAVACGYKTSVSLDIDVYSVATTENLQLSTVRVSILPKPHKMSQAIAGTLIAPSSGNKFGTLRLQAREPFCPSTTVVEFDDDAYRGYYASWKFDAGCLSTGESRDFSPTTDQLEGSGWPTRGKVTVKPEGGCGSLTFEDTKIRQLMSPSWTDPVPPPSPGLPPNSMLRPCGCWGPVLMNQLVSAPMCSSGAAINQACPIGQCLTPSGPTFQTSTFCK